MRLDRRRRAAVVDGRRVELSVREFRLLSYLMGESGGVCTRDALLKAVWGASDSFQTELVDIYVARLRDKIGTDLVSGDVDSGYRYAGDEGRPEPSHVN